MAQTYTVKQVAQILGYSTNSIYTFLNENRLKGIRVGKGRFRIPQSEIDRLMGEKKAPAHPAGITVSPDPVAAVIPDAVSEADSDLAAPDIFRWFIGISSVIFGASMMLFSGVSEEFSVRIYESFTVFVPFVVIVCGLGILLSDIAGIGRSFFARVCLGILAIVFAFAAQQSLDEGEVSTTGLLVLFSLFSLWNLVFQKDEDAGITGVRYAIIILASGVAVCTLLGFGVSFNIQVFDQTWVRGAISLYFFLAVAMLSIGRRYRRAFEVSGQWMVAAGFVLQSIRLAYAIHWAQALVFALAGVAVVVLRGYGQIRIRSRWDRSYVYGILSAIFLIFLLALGTVRIMQTNLTQYAENQLANKAEFGRFLVESTYESAVSSIESGASNPSVVSVLENPKRTDPTSTLRSMYAARSIFRSLLLYDVQKEDIIAAYPIESNSTPDSFAYLYTRAVETGKTQVSDIARTQGDSAMLVIAVPVRDSTNTVIGVFSGRVDVDVLTFKLAQLETAQLDEHVVLVDRYGADVESGSRIGWLNDTDVAGESLMVTRAVSGQNWSVVARAPLGLIIQSTTMYIVVILFIISISFSLVGLTSISIRKKVAVPLDSS